MKRPFSLVAFALVVLLAQRPADLSAQLFSGMGDAVAGEDAVSIGLLYGKMSPQTTFRDGGGFDSSSLMGLSVSFWAARYLGFQLSFFNTEHVGLLATDGRASVVSGRDPKIQTYLFDAIGRLPLRSTEAISFAPFVALGGGFKSYDFAWDTKGGPDARGLDLSWSTAVGAEARFGPMHRFGVRGEYRDLRTPMDRWGDELTHQDRVFTGGLLFNF